MPGIVGLATKRPRAEAERELLRMVAALRHEEFYTSGTWIDEAAGLYLGWVLRKGSSSDGMPFQNERGDVVGAFSGEEFPALQTRRSLKENGHEVSGGLSYLVHWYEEDPTFPAGLNGRFQGVVSDSTRQRALLFNDRFGLHRMYYHESSDSFYFAAEAKAILIVCPETRRADQSALAEIVACECVLENRTAFTGIRVLPPASAWVIENGAVTEKAAYFNPREWEEQEPLEPTAYYEEFRRTFTENLPRYFDGPEPVAMSLTGGLDGRMIMAWQRSPPGALPCYTFAEGNGGRQSRDAVVASHIAKACEQSHSVIPLGQEFFQNFGHYAERTVYLTDGCVDLVHSPDLLLNRQARAIAPVRMTGNYGSEVLRLSRAFGPSQPDGNVFEAEFAAFIAEAVGTYRKVSTGHPVSFAVFRQAPWYHYGLLALEETQLTLRSPYLDNDLLRTVFRAPHSALATNDMCFRLVGDGNQALQHIPTDRGATAIRAGLSGSVRRCFLEFMFRAEYAYDCGMPQWLARIDRVLSPFHPEKIFLGWHKFHHFRLWYRRALSGYIRDILLDPRTLSRPYLNGRRVERIVAAHISGLGNYTLELHKLLRLELMHRLFIDGR